MAIPAKTPGPAGGCPNYRGGQVPRGTAILKAANNEAASVQITSMRRWRTASGDRAPYRDLELYTKRGKR